MLAFQPPVLLSGPRGSHRSKAAVTIGAFVLLTACWLLITSHASAQIGGGRAVPRQIYFFAFEPFNQGEYREALRGFRSAANSGINTGAGRWVDSICYYTMTGECFYHLGNLKSALEQYDAALHLMIARRGWLQRIQIPPSIGPAVRTIKRVTWGRSSRTTVPGEFPETMNSMQGTNLDTILRQGGTFKAPELYPVRVTEIMRCIAVALSRRREILGPLATQMPLTSQVVSELSQPQVQANHWFQTLINVQYGIARASAGDYDEAMEILQGSLAVGGRFDHPLTSIALLEIGKLALRKNDLDLARRSFFDASFPAAFFRQADALEEGLIGAANVHTLKGAPGIFAPLSAAADWCRVADLDRAAVAMRLVAVEQAVLMGDAGQAARLLSQARSAMGRSDLRGADLGVQLLYRNAQIAFDTGNATVAAKALDEARRLHMGRSKRLFQIDLVMRMYASNVLSPRVTGLYLAHLLREPTPEDWQRNRFETLLLEMTPHLPALEQLLEITLDSSSGGNMEQLVRVSEMIRRHKFFSRLPIAGRMLALRWVLEGPEATLDKQTRTQRQSLLKKYPDLAKRSSQLQQLEVQLSRLPVVPDTPDESKAFERIGKQLVRAADEQEMAITRLTLRPDVANRVFPPLLTLNQVQRRLKDGQAILAFVASGRATHALLLTPDNRYKTWMLESPRLARTELASLMREIGNFDQKQVLLAERLTSDSWKEGAAELFRPLASELTVDLLQSLDELVIVPDGLLWYLPFEMLQVNVGGERKSLIDLVQIRYSPTIGLAVRDARPKGASGPRVIVHGRLFSRDTGEILTDAVDQLIDQVPQSTVLRRRLPFPSRYVAPSWGQLVVLDDIESADQDGLKWSPAQVDQGRPGGALLDWLKLPWGAPDVVVLPGFYTAAENGMRSRQSGDEMLVASCGLMAAGVRTVVLSRWRTGGRMSMELLREFLQELPQQTAAAAWQRSLLLARSSELDPVTEPRLKGAKPGEVPSADHPFFWAGYLMMGAW